jgi:hypothetical protein
VIGVVVIVAVVLVGVIGAMELIQGATLVGIVALAVAALLGGFVASRFDRRRS